MVGVASLCSHEQQQHPQVFFFGSLTLSAASFPGRAIAHRWSLLACALEICLSITAWSSDFLLLTFGVFVGGGAGETKTDRHFAVVGGSPLHGERYFAGPPDTLAFEAAVIAEVSAPYLAAGTLVLLVLPLSYHAFGAMSHHDSNHASCLPFPTVPGH